MMGINFALAADFQATISNYQGFFFPFMRNLHIGLPSCAPVSPDTRLPNPTYHSIRELKKFEKHIITHIGATIMPTGPKGSYFLANYNTY